jgi:hypothetical protein
MIAVMLTAATTAVRAGPCTEAINRVQAGLDAKAAAAAGSAPSAAETPAARLHRQPTPRSVADAASISQETVQAVRAAMARAREADRGGNRSACEQALADAQRAAGP